MKKLLIALSLLLCTAFSALAQTSITLPIAANSVADLGNGPIKVRMIAGNASIFTAQGSGTGSTSGSSTALTLTTTPATPPIVGALISGSGITSGTTVTAFNGTTGITLSAAMTVAGGTTVSWGAACSSTIPSAYIQASPQAGFYIMYTQARVCAVSPGGPVNTLLIEPIYFEQSGSGSGSTNPGGSPTDVQYNSSGVFGGISGVTSNGTAMTFASGDLLLSGSSSGTATLNAPATGGGTLTLPAGTTTLAGLGTTQTFSGTDSFSGITVQENFAYFNANTTAYPATASYSGLAISWNFSNGDGEVNFWDTYLSAAIQSFVWKQQTGTSAATTLAYLTPNGAFDVAAGFEIGSAATSGNVLRGNGTIFVSATLAAADLSNGVTGSGSVVLASSPSISGLTVTSSLTATGLVTLGDLATQSANTVLVNATSGAASPTAQSVSSCSAANDALNWTTNTGFGCGTAFASLSTADQTLTGGANVTSESQSTGSISMDCGARPLQYITASTSAWTITAPSNDGSCALLVTNPGTTATAPSFSGFSVGSNTGDAYLTTASDKFMLIIIRINGSSTYSWKALQ